MNSRDRILAALRLEQPDRVPFADDIEKKARRMLMGQEDIRDEDFDDLEFVKEFGVDAIDFYPSLYYAPNFCNKKVVDGHEYMLGGLLKSENDLKLMKFQDPNDESYYDPLKKFVEIFSKNDIATFVYMSWGIEGVLNSMGIEAFSFALFDNYKLVETILDRYIEWNITLMEHLNGIGIDFVSSYNNVAYNTGPMFSPQVFRELVIPRFKQVADVCKLPWVYHGDGNIMPLMDDLMTLNMNCIRPIQPGPMDLKTMKENYGDKVCLWGNVDISYTLTRGTPEEVEKEVKECIDIAGKGGGYIAGSSSCIADYCKVENAWAMSRAIKKYGKY